MKHTVRSVGRMWAVEDDVVVVHWPAEADRRRAAAADGRGRLLLVPQGVDPPVLDQLEDWMREPIDGDDLDARRAAVGRRVARHRPAAIDDDGLLRRGSQWRPLADLEIAALRPLLARPSTVVRRDALAERLWPGGDAAGTRRLDSLMQRLRRRAAPLGIHIRTVRSVGFLLEYAEPR